MRIREGDPLEIFVSNEGEVIFKKYSPISELGSIAAQYCEVLYCSMSWFYPTNSLSIAPRLTKRHETAWS